MVNSKKHEFKEYILDQLRLLDGVESKQMFGGLGLYCKGIFFGIIADGGVYFKTDAATVGTYKDKGMEPFKPSAKQTLKNYYEVPPEILEDEQQLTIKKAYQKCIAGYLVKSEQGNRYEKLKDLVQSYSNAVTPHP